MKDKEYYLDFKLKKDVKEFQQRINDLLENITKKRKADIIYRHRYVKDDIHTHEIITFIKDGVCYSTGEMTQIFIKGIENEYFSLMYCKNTYFNADKLLIYVNKQLKQKDEIELWSNYLKHSRKDNDNLNIVRYLEAAAKNLCKIEGCYKPVKSRGLCNNHYSKKYKRRVLRTAKNSSREKCKVAGCDEPAYATGYCNRHYQQVRSTGKILEEDKRCKAPHCDRKSKSLGYCSKHYQQIYRYGQLTPEREQGSPKRFCSVKGCNNLVHAKGYCSTHYYYHLNNKEIKVWAEICKVDGCNKNVRCKGLCDKHYRQELKNRKSLTNSNKDN